MKIKAGIPFVFLLLHLGMFAQQGTFPEHFGDIFKSDKMLLGKRVIAGDVGYAFQNVEFIETPGEVSNYLRHAIRANVNVNPKSQWFLRTTFYLDLNQSDQTPVWLANVFYQVGYYDWRNRRFSFGYENFQPNRFKNAQVDFLTNLRRGHFFVSYNFALEQGERDNRHILLLDHTSRIVLSPFVRIHPEFPNDFNDFGGYFKPVAGAMLRYVIYRNFYIEGAVYFYPISRTVVPWDPDFTYGFGVFNWQSFRVNVSYGNWIANRFPWNESQMPFHGILNGELNVSVTWAW